MLSYEQLDRVADAHNPLLGVMWALLCLAPLFRRQWGYASARFVVGICALLVAYGLMWLDNAAVLWPRLGWDYSTHTAVAVALALVILGISTRVGILACVASGAAASN